MLTNDVHLDHTKSELIRHNKNHIENVFGITVSCCRHENEHDYNGDDDEKGGVCKVRLSSQNSQESIDKAKNYIAALTGEGKDFVRKTEELSLQDFNMVLENQNDIENESQAVLELIENCHQICMYGRHKNVQSAQALIEKMRSKLQGNEAYFIHDSIPKCGTDTYISHTNVITHSMETTRTGSNNISLITERQESLQTDCGPEIFPHFSIQPHEIDLDNMVSPFGNKSSSSSHDGDVVVSPDESASDQFSFTNVGSSQSYSDDENDEEVDRIIQDTKNREKIEFALKLGYSQSQIAMVLKKLGPDVGQNEMLSELIKVGMTCSYGNNNEDSENDESYFSKDGSLPFASYGDDENQTGLRPIVIDGSNVAMSHGSKDVFSCQGIQLAVEWFRRRGHTQITVFVPQWRKETSRPDARIKDQEILSQLEKENVIVFTPSRRIGGKRVVCYDDRYVLKLAAENEGIVVSNDNYRDLINERPEYKKVVEERLLMFSFVNDRFMPPEDPLGRHGPSLDNFLKHPHAISQECRPPPCPYGSKKCTYGNKCKFYHPERGNIPQKSVTDKLAEQSKQRLQEVRAKQEGKKKEPLSAGRKPKLALQRTKSLASELPADLVADKVEKDLRELTLDDILKREPEKDEKWKQYDDKLSEKRKQLEKAEEEDKMKQEEVKKLVEFDHLRKLQSNTRSNTPSPSNRLSPSPIRHQEQFLSGHLLLAKKLSDEANESKLRRSEEHSYTKSPLAATQSVPVVPQQPVSQPPQHKKLSRQYSLQGSHDPRLKPSVRPQVSYDPNMYNRGQSAFGGEPYQPQPSRAIFGQQAHEQYYRPDEDNVMHSASYVRESYKHRLLNQDERFLTPESHMALTRMQSAPEVPQHLREQYQPMGRPIGKMIRQNSSSDTQLHVMGGENESMGYNFVPHGNVERFTTRHDSVTYHIGSQNQQEQYRRSMSGQFHYQTDQMYSHHHSTSNDPPWGFPEPPLQQGFGGMGSHSGIPGHQPLFNRGSSQEFTSLRTRGGPVWSDSQTLQTMSYSSAGDQRNEPYQHYVPTTDYHMQSQMAPDCFGAQSRPAGVPILGASNSSSQSSNYQPILPTDKRYSIYYHLCGLFPEEKVRVVMNQFPELDNPQELCAYIIGAK